MGSGRDVAGNARSTTGRRVQRGRILKATGSRHFNAETSNSFGPIMKLFHHVSNEKVPPQRIQLHNFLNVSMIESIIGDQRMGRITVPIQSGSQGYTENGEYHHGLTKREVLETGTCGLGGGASASAGRALASAIVVDHDLTE